MIERRTLLAGSLLLAGCTGVGDEALSKPAKIVSAAQDWPPRLLAPFEPRFDHAESSGPVTEVWFEVGCAGCGRGLFSVFETIAFFRAADTAESLETPAGISLTCDECGRGAQLFDLALHGYDGELGHNAFLGADRKARALQGVQGGARVRAGFTFNTPTAELDALARPIKRNAQDLFDWFNLQGNWGRGWTDIWDAECA